MWTVSGVAGDNGDCVWTVSGVASDNGGCLLTVSGVLEEERGQGREGPHISGRLRSLHLR